MYNFGLCAEVGQSAEVPLSKEKWQYAVILQKYGGMLGYSSTVTYHFNRILNHF